MDILLMERNRTRQLLKSVNNVTNATNAAGGGTGMLSDRGGSVK